VKYRGLRPPLVELHRANSQAESVELCQMLFSGEVILVLF
jgi:hypothetical protein